MQKQGGKSSGRGEINKNKNKSANKASDTHHWAKWQLLSKGNWRCCFSGFPAEYRRRCFISAVVVFSHFEPSNCQSWAPFSPCREGCGTLSVNSGVPWISNGLLLIWQEHHRRQVVTSVYTSLNVDESFRCKEEKQVLSDYHQTDAFNEINERKTTEYQTSCSINKV